MSMPAPYGHGWKLDDGTISVDWMSITAAPTSVLASIHCSCTKTGCVKGRCSCLLNEQCCTDCCKCVNCANVPSQDDCSVLQDDTNPDSDSDSD